MIIQIVNGFWTVDGKKYSQLSEEKRKVLNEFFIYIKEKKMEL